MEAVIPLAQGLALKMRDTPSAAPQYATGLLSRGLLLMDGDQELTEEAVGFGVPVVKRGLETIFPGNVRLDLRQVGRTSTIRAQFKLNLVERFAQAGNGNLKSGQFYALKNLLAAAMRHLPASRGPLTASSSRLREMFHWETTYADAGFEAVVNITCSAPPGAERVTVEVDAGELRGDITEVVIMHEQGARAFDRYQDSSGIRIQRSQIGCWDEVRAAEARFESSSHRIAFRLRRLPGARLFRGRELIGSRLAWAGFGYSFPPSLKKLDHEITISRLA